MCLAKRQFHYIIYIWNNKGEKYYYECLLQCIGTKPHIGVY